MSDRQLPAVDAVEVLARGIAANRFLPVPPPELHFVGDGDFRAIGAEFLRHFVRLGGVRPTDAVLEIGCGVGRMALPLTQWLEPGRGSYDGIDVVAGGIDWARRTISPLYGNFRFHHLDVFNALYNPAGRIASDQVALPFADASFDFVLLTSVVTHLDTAETARYAAEIARLLRPGGRCFVSLFLINDAARAGLRADRRRLSFDPEAEGPEFQADAAHPGAAVAYDEAFLCGLLAQAGLSLSRPIAYGHWCGRAGDSYQDLCVFAKAGEK